MNSLSAAEIDKVLSLHTFARDALAAATSALETGADHEEPLSRAIEMIGELSSRAGTLPQGHLLQTAYATGGSLILEAQLARDPARLDATQQILETVRMGWFSEAA